MEAYSMDLRTRALAACDTGHKTKEVATLALLAIGWAALIRKRRAIQSRLLAAERLDGW